MHEIEECFRKRIVENQKQGDKEKTLSSALCADPRALSTYTEIVKWLIDEKVDVLQNASESKYYGQERNAKGVIVNRPAFLNGRSLPDEKTRWWGGGIEEAVATSSDESDQDELNDKGGEGTSAAPSVGILQRLWRGLSVETAPQNKTGSKKDTDQQSKKAKRSADSAEPQVDNKKRNKLVKKKEKGSNGKNAQAKKEVSKELIKRMKKQREHKYTFMCPKCCAPIPRDTKSVQCEKGRAKGLYLDVRCPRQHCTWRGHAKKLLCFFCRRVSSQCFCSANAMMKFSVNPEKAADADKNLDRIKQVYFLHCPGKCGGWISFPFKPPNRCMQRMQIICESCRNNRSSVETQKTQWRFRIGEALCRKCKLQFQKCECPVEYSKEELSKVTLCGAMLRGQMRQRNREHITFMCGPCGVEMSAADVHPREW